MRLSSWNGLPRDTEQRRLLYLRLSIIDYLSFEREICAYLWVTPTPVFTDYYCKPVLSLAIWSSCLSLNTRSSETPISVFITNFLELRDSLTCACHCLIRARRFPYMFLSLTIWSFVTPAFAYRWLFLACRLIYLCLLPAICVLRQAESEKF